MAEFVSLEKTDDRTHTWISFQNHYAAGIRKVFHILHTGVNTTKNVISVNPLRYFTREGTALYTHRDTHISA